MNSKRILLRFGFGWAFASLFSVGSASAELSFNTNSGFAAGSPLSSQDQVTSITQFSDVYPTDWAYQALSNLVERYGCVAGYPNGTYRGNRAMTRFEAAALLNACLDRITEVTDELKRLMKEFERELAILKGRVDGLEARVGELEATQFSTTTKLEAEITFVIGANRFAGMTKQDSEQETVDQSNALYGATAFNYNQDLILNTSFTGKDNLIAVLRVGDFDGGLSVFGGGGPSPLSQLSVAFQEGDTPNHVIVEKLFYTFPFSPDLTFTIGANVGQEDMLAIWPSVYPSSSVLDVLTLNGAPGAYNMNLGSGAGISWSRHGFSITANYVAANGASSNSFNGGISGHGSGGTGTLQIGYEVDGLGLAAIYSLIQNGNEIIVYGSDFALDSYANPGTTSAFALSGYWQPQGSGWIPSISLGWGINNTAYESSVFNDPLVDQNSLVSTSQSWALALEWSDVFLRSNQAGIAVGQPVFATSLENGEAPRDGNYVWEWWYQFHVTDNISVTPALFYLSRPYGQNTSFGDTFSQLGGLLKTSFRF